MEDKGLPLDELIEFVEFSDDEREDNNVAPTPQSVPRQSPKELIFFTEEQDEYDVLFNTSNSNPTTSKLHRQGTEEPGGCQKSPIDHSKPKTAATQNDSDRMSSSKIQEDEISARLVAARCHWANCSSGDFESLKEFSTHVNNHVQNHFGEELQQQKVMCEWYGCDNLKGAGIERRGWTSHSLRHVKEECGIPAKVSKKSKSERQR